MEQTRIRQQAAAPAQSRAGVETSSQRFSRRSAVATPPRRPVILPLTFVACSASNVPGFSQQVFPALCLNVSVGAFQKLDKGSSLTSQKRRNAASPGGSGDEHLDVIQRDKGRMANSIWRSPSRPKPGRFKQALALLFCSYSADSGFAVGESKFFQGFGKSLYLKSSQTRVPLPSRTVSSADGFVVFCRLDRVPLFHPFRYPVHTGFIPYGEAAETNRS